VCRQYKSDFVQDDHSRTTLRRNAILRQLGLGFQSFVYRFSLLQISLQEMYSCVCRIRLRWKRRPFRVRGLPVYRLAPNGMFEPCTETPACMRDTGNFFSSRQGATLIDFEIYQEGWIAGARWGVNNPR